MTSNFDETSFQSIVKAGCFIGAAAGFAMLVSNGRMLCMNDFLVIYTQEVADTSLHRQIKKMIRQCRRQHASMALGQLC